MRAFLHRCGSVPNPEAEKDGKEGECDGSNGQHDADKDDDDDLFAPEGKAAATGFLQEGTEEEVMRQARDSCLAAQALVQQWPADTASRGGLRASPSASSTR